eukprot:TRINITY_DN3819_c0_g2_i1.p1 TRINITY_DN3819_c0_g2~~TRINITY_DN3819_c0_g2_i1.p1  ORF type:complete len:212 (-),score=22.01 TRINITY_DN3819_c0_g2_i1:134-769(-)
MDYQNRLLSFVTSISCSKIEPRLFRTWMNILKKVPNSVLWLIDHNMAGADLFLREQAIEHGVDPNRLIIAGFETNKTEYLYRSRLGDLMLDNWIYNSGTTGADALWSGVPLLTLYGAKASQRMGATLVAGVGLRQELVVNTEEEYEERAVKLALEYQSKREESELQRCKRRLEMVRWSSDGKEEEMAPLFDTARQVRELERVLTQMWANYK